MIKKQLLLTRFFTISLCSMLCTLLVQAQQRAPLNQHHQNILDEMVQKFNVGKRGEYKGYILGDHPVSLDNKEKQICITESLLNLPQEELEFIIGRHVGYKADINWRINRDSCIIQTIFGLVGILGGLELKHNTQSQSSLYEIGGFIFGLVAGWQTAHSHFVPDQYVYCDTLQLNDDEMQYMLDRISVETLNCHNAAINYLKRSENNSFEENQKLNYHNRIARIEELLRKKQ